MQFRSLILLLLQNETRPLPRRPEQEPRHQAYSYHLMLGFCFSPSMVCRFNKHDDRLTGMEHYTGYLMTPKYFPPFFADLLVSEQSVRAQDRVAPMITSVLFGLPKRPILKLTASASLSVPRE